MITAERGSHKITRNISFFKKITATPIPENEPDEESDDPIPIFPKPPATSCHTNITKKISAA